MKDLIKDKKEKPAAAKIIMELGPLVGKTVKLKKETLC